MEKKGTYGGARSGAGARKKTIVRSATITTLLTEEERKKIAENAESVGMSVAGLIRSRCIYNFFPTKMKTFVSAGHGGKDSGAVVGDITEARIAYSVASKLVQLCVKNKKKVKFVGKTTATAATIIQMRCIKFTPDDLLIDIHANAAANESANGVEVWIAEEKMRPTAERIAASMAEKLGMRNRWGKKGF
jgi:N-acetylmuramoyl-L-alanine amidase